jgi:ribosomal protein S18 acetylase RimI-like enzyme
MEEKTAELSHNKARFLVLLDENSETGNSDEDDKAKTQDLAGFCHYRFEYDDEDSPSEAVLYVYELQIRDRHRRQGLGRKVMSIMEKMAQDFELPKVMLTVFYSNEKAMEFYKRMHYSADDTSPSKFGEKVDYEILSKKV